MSQKAKLRKLFHDAFERGDRTLATQVWELNQLLEKDGLTLQEIHEISLDYWAEWIFSWEEKYKQLVKEELLLDPDGDLWGSTIVAGNWYPYLDGRKKHMGKHLKNLSLKINKLLDKLAADEKKRFFRDIIPTPYM